MLINKIESTGLMHLNDSKAFVEYSHYVDYMDDICRYIEEYNSSKKHKILIAFDMIPDMLSN